MAAISVVTITDKDLANHLEAATSRIMSFTYRPPRKKEAEPEAGSAALGGRRFAFRPLQSLAPGAGATAAAEEKLSIVEAIQGIDPKDDLPTDVEHHVLRCVRRGIQVFFHINQDYLRASGLERLKDANRTSELPAGQETELKAKVETATMVSLFSLAHFVSRSLRDYQRDAADALNLDVEPPDPVSVRSTADALNAVLCHYHEAVKAHARDDASLVRVTRDVFRLLVARIQTMKDSFRFTDFFTRYHYRIEPDDIVVSGFDVDEAAASTAVDVVQKRPEEVVGNHIAKMEVMRLAQRLVCYDRERQRNPFVDIGGFSFTFIGDGSPGTGKTTLIQMLVSLLRGYCEALGLPLRYLNFSIDEISDYQGRSAQNAKRFCREVMDPKVIGFGTIDDVDQVCANRNDKNSSSGQLEVTAVFMQEFAGPNTVIRGNASFGLFSNYPDKVDNALRQRMQGRFQVDGPKCLEDFADLFHLLLRDCWELPAGSGYEPFLTQQIRRVIQAKYQEHDRPSSPALLEIFERVGGPKLSTWIDFARYLHALQQHDERFTGRAVRNIAEAVKFRMMDFDLPGEWFEKPDLFFRQPYEKKLAMLKELRGTVTPAMVLQEINRYADSEARYAGEADERELEERTRQIMIEVKARRNLAGKDV